MTQLTEHFTFEEFTKTKHELLQEENKLQGEQFIDNMTRLANQLEILRTFVFRPIFITSGFRFTALNMRVGGSPVSQHMTASAVDFTVKDFQDLQGLNFIFDWCGHHLDHGQIILEAPADRKPWIHMGLPREGRKKQKLVNERGVYRIV